MSYPHIPDYREIDPLHESVVLWHPLRMIGRNLGPAIVGELTMSGWYLYGEDNGPLGVGDFVVRSNAGIGNITYWGNRFLYAQHDSLVMGTGSFCYEFYAKKYAQSTDWARYFETEKDGTSGGLNAISGSSNTTVYYRAHSSKSSRDFDVGMPEVSAGVWRHVAISRDAPNQRLRLWVDGALAGDGPVASAVNLSSNKIAIFSSLLNGNVSDCAMCDFRVTKGHPRYTEPFTPPVLWPIRAGHNPFWLIATGWQGQYSGTEQTLSGTLVRSSGGPGDVVLLMTWPSRLPVAEIQPAADGTWSYPYARVGESYFILYLAENCAPVAHGPYAVVA